MYLNSSTLTRGMYIDLINLITQPYCDYGFILINLGALISIWTNQILSFQIV